MRLKKFITLEVKGILGRRYITIALIFLVASGYFIQYGISQYKHIQEEKYNFLEFERLKYNQFLYPSMYGNYGLRLLFEPSPMMVFFDSGVPVPDGMTAHIDGSERIRVYQPLVAQSAFTMIASAFMTFAGFVSLFGSSLVSLFGFLGTKDHEWLKLLENSSSRKKLFFYLLISKAFILLFFCLALAGLSILLFIINGVAVNPGQVLVISLAAFVMLLCFLIGGLSAGTLKNRFWGWASMIIAWFVMAFVIPVLIYHWTHGRAASIKSPYKREIVKQELFMGYEKGSLEEGGEFDKSKYGEKKEIQMFLAFWNGGFLKVIQQEKDMLEEMKDRISFCQTLSALFPSTFFLSVNNEMSSRGFSNLVGFNEYAQEKKKAFIWYIADIYILSDKISKKEFTPFIKHNENIYQGQSRLPGNFNFGMAVTVLWLLVLVGLYWFRFNRMLDHVPKINTTHELKTNKIKNNITNVVITADRGPYPRLLYRLRSQDIAYVAIPKPAHIPGEVKVKDLLGLFGLAVPGKLEKKAGKYIYSLELDDKAQVLLEIIRSLQNKPVIIIFDNFLSDLSDDCIADFAELLQSKSFKKTVVYFTKSILTSTKIADYVHKFSKEKQVY